MFSTKRENFLYMAIIRGVATSTVGWTSFIVEPQSLWVLSVVARKHLARLAPGCLTVAILLQIASWNPKLGGGHALRPTLHTLYFAAQGLHMWVQPPFTSYFKSDGYNPLTVTDTIKLAKICADDCTQHNLFSFSYWDCCSIVMTDLHLECWLPFMHFFLLSFGWSGPTQYR